LAIGLIDAVAETELRSAARALADEFIESRGPARTAGLRARTTAEALQVQQIAAKILAKARGQVAPAEAIRLVRLSESASLADGLAEERATFLRLQASPQSAALRHVFFAERHAAKLPELEGVAARSIATVGVVGAGLMGAGIVVALADAGFQVLLVEQNAEALAAGETRVNGLYDRALASDRITSDERDRRTLRIHPSTELNSLSIADLVIEAVFDDLDVKQSLFKTLSAIVRPDAVLATNTSYLDPDAIASVIADPSRVIGLHFFSPANIMRLVEVVKTTQAAPDALATGIALARKLGKLPVVCGVTEGFIGNRIFSAYRNECEALLSEGALPQEIDAAMEDYGMAMGPLAVFDMAGLEIAWARRKRQRARGMDVPKTIADTLCELGRFGAKTGLGWYAYAGGKAVDPAVTVIVRAVQKPDAAPIEKGEIQSRLVAAMATEGDHLLKDGIAFRSSDIDVVMIHGYGFPAWRGGPMFVRRAG
jgi:3-hydroxyacyl-CoA dehydrogenase